VAFTFDDVATAGAKVIAALPRRARSRLVMTSTFCQRQAFSRVASLTTTTLAVTQASSAASASAA
jgi:hypothetical protein